MFFSKQAIATAMVVASPLMGTLPSSSSGFDWGHYSPEIPRSTTEKPSSTSRTVAKTTPSGTASVPTKTSLQTTPITSAYFATHTSPKGTTSQYHIFADGIDWSKNVNVIVRLHGDGDGTYVHEFDGYKRSGMLNDFAREARTKNAIVIAPKSPDRIGHTTWWENMEKNDEWLNSLIATKLLSHPAIAKDRIYWMGYSGGSEFLSYHYIPKHPDMVTGGVLMCSGGGASIYSERLIKNSATDRGIPLSWYVGQLDDGSTSIDGFDAVSATKRGYDTYKRNGFVNAKRVVVPGKDHYNIDQRAIFNTALLRWVK